ncbi:hypothetical protein BH23ACT4_BH23ACT4_07280 [soil metagenome]
MAASGVLTVAAGLFWGLEADFPPLVVTVDWLIVVAVGCLALLVSTFRVQNHFVLGVATLAALFALGRALAWLFADGPATLSYRMVGVVSVIATTGVVVSLGRRLVEKWHRGVIVAVIIAAGILLYMYASVSRSMSVA